MDAFVPRIDHYAWYEDGSESGSSIVGSEDNAPTRNNDSDSPIHLRLLIAETGAGSAGGMATDDWQLQYDVNSAGSWADVNAASSRVQTDTSPATVSDTDATTDRGTNGLTNPGSGSFVAGIVEAGDGEITNHELTADNFTEHLWALILVSADNSDTDTIDFRVQLNGTEIADNVGPSIVIDKAAVVATRRVIMVN